MKIGRNDPCPCGSGKKYKKCCLNKTAIPPEARHCQRLREAHDRLWPKLVAYGTAIFGETAHNVAFTEFLTWPAPEDAPDETAIERAEHLFWPWYIFNWEYCETDDVENLLKGPEHTTIAELFLQEKNVDPESEEGRILLCANRAPYSFHEIVSTDVGHTVTIRDLLTGHEHLVQESLGSEYVQKGDILFGRAVQLDDVVMFMGMGSYKIPPRIKPEVTRMRRELSRHRGMITEMDLYEWEFAILNLYWDIDRRLHTMPEMVNTEGAPMELHETTGDAQKNAERMEQTRQLISGFGAKRLPDLYTGFCLRLCDAIAASDDLNLHRGRVEIWAAAIVYAIARLNFLFSPETPNCLTTDEICSKFGVKKSTVGNKASMILDTLGIFHSDRRFCAPHITRLFEFVEDELGFIYPRSIWGPRTAPRADKDGTHQPVALKPSGGQAATPNAKREKTKKRPANQDDRQLELFPDWKNP
jgi:hypothetical protein